MAPWVPAVWYCRSRPCAAIAAPDNSVNDYAPAF